MMTASLERYQALVENSWDAISLVNAEGNVLYASASTAKVLGYRPEELLGRNGLDLLHPLDRGDSARILERVLAEPDSPKRMQARVIQKDGQWRWVESTLLNLLSEPHVAAIVMSYREIPDQDEEDGQWQQRRSDTLVRANAELRAFAYTAAHDLREPLRSMAALTELLVARVPLDQDSQRIAGLILAAAGRMSSLLDGLLAQAVEDAADPLAPVELEQSASVAVENLREALTASGASVRVSSLPVVLGDATGMIRLFQNLLSNAVKYRSQAAPDIRITSEWLGAEWVIRVSDNGLGIPEEHHRRIFEPFVRLLPHKAPGVGIGLANCQKIVKQMGGVIWVESEPGVGSEFCFTALCSRRAASSRIEAGPPR